ncbi:MAG: 50S ribosomal protein L11 methyltransferase [Pseudomonadota bacterium]
MTDDILARYPNVRGNAQAMALLSGVLTGKNRHGDALALALAAIRTAPDDMQVRHMIGDVLSAGVPRFHAPMLHDAARNRAYVSAIEAAVRPGMLVLEIGTGAGLLALVAARAGARVVTCEANPAVAAAAREIVARNGYADRITVVAKQSDGLSVGDELDRPADLLVSEIFGDTLFGEGIVAAIADAKARLLKPGAPILPPRAELRCALVDALARPRSAPLNDVEGFDLSPFELLARPIGRRIRAEQNQPVVVRSPAHSALAVDFDTAKPFGRTRETVVLESTGGRVDAVALWMRIDFGGGIVLESDPFTLPASHWTAPLFDLPAPIETVPGERIDVAVNVTIARVTVNARRQST